MGKNNLSGIEILQLYRSLAIEKKTFFESKRIYQILIQVSLASYFVYGLLVLIEKYLTAGSLTFGGYALGSICFLFLIVIAFPRIAPAGSFQLRLLPIALLAGSVWKTLHSDINWLWYVRLSCVLLAIISIPAFIDFHKRVWKAKKVTLEKYSQDV